MSLTVTSPLGAESRFLLTRTISIEESAAAGSMSQ